LFVMQRTRVSIAMLEVMLAPRCILPPTLLAVALSALAVEGGGPYPRVLYSGAKSLRPHPLLVRHLEAAAQANTTTQHEWPTRMQGGALAESADAEYEEYIWQWGLTNNLTADELARFRERYMLHAADDMGSNDASSNRGAQVWKTKLQLILEDQMPVVTTREVEDVNRAGVNWEAGKPQWADDFTMRDARVLQGSINDDNIKETSLDEVWNSEIKIINGSRRLGDTSGFPTSFDGRERWPPCKETIGQVRDQGKCGSCWAQASAGAMDGRMCVATQGQFTGQDAWISAGYITQCYNMVILIIPINGCNGGNPGWALQQAGKSFFGGGAPTRSCVPYFGSGDSLQHFDSSGNVEAPSCPRQCTNPGHNRQLKRDLFYTSGIVTKTADFYTATWLLSVAGSIAMSFDVYKDFMAYKGGYYKPTGGDKLGGHAVTMIGWDTLDGERYNLCVNSWGEDWGDKGTFKICATTCAIDYYIPTVSASQRSLPLPTGPTAPLRSVEPTKLIVTKEEKASASFTNLMSIVLPPSGVEISDDRLRVVTSIQGIACTSLSAAEQELLQDWVGKKISASFPYEFGTVMDINGAENGVSILPCLGDNATEEGLLAISEKSFMDFFEAHCDSSPDPNTVYIAFTVAAPGNATDVDNVLQGTTFKAAVTAGVQAARGLDTSVVRDVCVVKENEEETGEELVETGEELVKFFPDAKTTLSSPVAAGSTSLPVASTTGFALGDTIMISDGSLSEENTISGFGSIVLATALVNSYAAGAVVFVQVEEEAADDAGAETDVPAAVGLAWLIVFAICILIGLAATICTYCMMNIGTKDEVPKKTKRGIKQSDSDSASPRGAYAPPSTAATMPLAMVSPASQTLPMVTQTMPMGSIRMVPQGMTVMQPAIPYAYTQQSSTAGPQYRMG